MKIGIYGGTFNPPHRGHVLAAASAVRELGLDRLIVMPSGTPPHKEVPAGNPDGEERLALARLAFASVDRAEVSDYEVASEGKDYTIDTLNWFEERCPGDELILITGGDMFRTLPEWKRGEELLRRFSVAVLAREFEEEPELTAAAEAYRADYGATVYFPKAEVFPVSSTEIRKLVQSGDMRGAARLLGHPYFVTGPVLHGHELGRTMGFPTLNLRLPPEKVAPPRGVYAALTHWKRGGSSRLSPGVSNLGFRPTVNGDADDVTLETNLFDSPGDLYGSDVTVWLFDFLRPEERFASVENLREAIARDSREAERVLSSLRSLNEDEYCL